MVVCTTSTNIRLVVVIDRFLSPKLRSVFKVPAELRCAVDFHSNPNSEHPYYYSMLESWISPYVGTYHTVVSWMGDHIEQRGSKYLLFGSSSSSGSNSHVNAQTIGHSRLSKVFQSQKQGIYRRLPLVPVGTYTFIVLYTLVGTFRVSRVPLRYTSLLGEYILHCVTNTERGFYLLVT